MSKRQVTVEYSGSTLYDIDETLIADDLGPEPTDEEIETAIRKDIDGWMEYGDSAPANRRYVYDRTALIASVRAEIERRKSADADGVA